MGAGDIGYPAHGGLIRRHIRFVIGRPEQVGTVRGDRPDRSLLRPPRMALLLSTALAQFIRHRVADGKAALAVVKAAIWLMVGFLDCAAAQ